MGQLKASFVSAGISLLGFPRESSGWRGLLLCLLNRHHHLPVLIGHSLLLGGAREGKLFSSSFFSKRLEGQELVPQHLLVRPGASTLEPRWRALTGPLAEGWIKDLHEKKSLRGGGRIFG